MAHIDVTKNKNGRLQAKIMFYGKDAVTQKTKLLSRRIYNDDNLTEAKFRRYAEKVAIQLEEQYKQEYVEGTSAIRNNVVTFSELCDEWKANVLQTLSRNYYSRICEVQKRFNAYLEEVQLAHRPISDIKVRDVQLFLNRFMQPKAELSKTVSLIKPLPKKVNFRELAREGIITRNTSYLMNNDNAKISVEKAQAICEKYNLDFYEYFDQKAEVKKYAVETIKGYRRVLRTLFNEAVRYEWITKNPVSATKITANNNNTSLKPITEKQVFSIQESKVFLKALQNVPEEFIFRKICVKFMLLTGVRTCELHGLRWSDIDLHNKKVKIVRNRLYTKDFGIYEKETKSKTSEREIPLTDDLVEDLKKYMDWFRIADDEFDNKLDEYYFAVNIYRQPEGIKSTSQWLNKFEKKNGFKQVSCHGLRHTYCSLLLAQNVPIQTVSKYMGHSDSTITLQVYSHFIPDTKERVVNALNNLMDD